MHLTMSLNIMTIISRLTLDVQYTECTKGFGVTLFTKEGVKFTLQAKPYLQMFSCSELFFSFNILQ